MTTIDLTPETAQVDDGATLNFYSDSQAFTIIDVLRNGRQIVIQRDNAVRSNQDEDSFAPGGFAGHTSHGRNGQQWDITRNTDGHTFKANWSAKYNRFFVGGPKAQSVTAGRYERYDYNF